MFTLKELAALTAATLIGDPELLISGINTLEEALSTDASFLANPKYGEAMKNHPPASSASIPKHPLFPAKITSSRQTPPSLSSSSLKN